MESGRFVQIFTLGSAFILAGEALPEELATYQPYKVPALVAAQNLEAEGFERILKQAATEHFRRPDGIPTGPATSNSTKTPESSRHTREWVCFGTRLRISAISSSI